MKSAWYATHDLTCVVGALAHAASSYPRGAPSAISPLPRDLAVAAVAFAVQLAIDEAGADPESLRALEGELIAALEARRSVAETLGTARESLAHVPGGVRADDHHGGLAEPLGELAAQESPPAEQRVAVEVLGRENLDGVGLLQLAVPEPTGLRKGGPLEVQARQFHEGGSHLPVADPIAGLVGEVRDDVEPDGAGGSVIGHGDIVSKLCARGKFQSNQCYLYFEVDRRERTVEIQTSWLPGIAPVKEALAPLGFARQPRGDWRATVSVDDFVGVSRRVARALELLLTEALQLIE